MRHHVLGWLSCFAVIASGCGELPEVCGPDSNTTAIPLQPHPTAGFLAYAHAHNDYEHDRPLEDALSHSFHSVEADVFFAGGKFEVSHLGFGAKGTLEDLYLRPLQQKVDAGGAVLNDGAPFALWLDLKDANDELPSKLRALLERYPLGRIADGGGAATSPAVTIVLTGDARMKAAVADLEIPNVFRDSNDFSPDDPPAAQGWTHYALDWGKYVGWGGDGALPSDTAERLACIVNRAHELARKVRFYNAPDEESGWKASADFGADYIGGDDLAGIERYLRER